VGPSFGAGPVADPRHLPRLNENDRLRYRGTTRYGLATKKNRSFLFGGCVTTPTLSGVHHVKFAVSDLDAAVSWYERVLRAERQPRLDHHDDAGDRFAVMLALPGAEVLVQLRHTAGLEAASTGEDAVIFGVADRAELQRWVEHLDAEGIEHSAVSTAMAGFSMTLTTPDGGALRLYTDPVVGFDALKPAHPQGS
jgi:catechol 2,3-dioxygenase-like lactoylglutathione lyase family enzyme